jgi:hypothetical protein
MTDNSAYPTLLLFHTSLPAQSSRGFHLVRFIAFMLLRITLSFHHIMIFMLSKSVCILLKKLLLFMLFRLF